jgi:hypothetical protein
MQTGDSHDYFKKYHISASVLIIYIENKNWKSIARENGAGPSINYVHPDANVKFGFIAP